ncbi:MAG: class I SAM-dependent methyltransferase, partial [Candidatus Omnitrophica bacterium]|nr:class I SAM-dependent methyltransferase [Candidatus Omnitrophota bacterium]
LTRRDIDYFYDESFATSSWQNKSWGDDFCELVLKTFHPQSVIDFGCGTADLLHSFEKKGLEILGIDGSRANYNHCYIKKENFLLFDIRNKLTGKKKFDLCISLEVAEHIEEKYSRILISNLVQHSSVVLFTAAPPGQVGPDHINLQPYEWWIKRFEAVNFRLDTIVTEHLKQEMVKIPGVQNYYIRNLFVFKLNL